MNQDEYYYNKSSYEVRQSDIQHEAIMNRLHEQQDYSLVSLLRPTITKDGSQWCCLYGEDLQVGIAGFGDTPHLAIIDFNKAFHRH